MLSKIRIFLTLFNVINIVGIYTSTLPGRSNRIRAIRDDTGGGFYYFVKHSKKIGVTIEKNVFKPYISYDK